MCNARHWSSPRRRLCVWKWRWDCAKVKDVAYAPGTNTIQWQLHLNLLSHFRPGISILEYRYELARETRSPLVCKHAFQWLLCKLQTASGEVEGAVDREAEAFHGCDAQGLLRRQERVRGAARRRVRTSESPALSELRAGLSAHPALRFPNLGLPLHAIQN